jgi:hypothetical protein
VELPLERLKGLWQIAAETRMVVTYGHRDPFRILFYEVVPVLIQFGIKWGTLRTKDLNSPDINMALPLKLSSERNGNIVIGEDGELGSKSFFTHNLAAKR